MKSRTGKIARLPKFLRDEVNQRLADGEEGESLLKWLNKTVPCKEMLAEHFDGKPINKQNLSDWKQGGYQEWLRNQEARERVQLMVDQAQDLEGEAEGPTLADRLATVLTLQLIDMTRQLESIAEPGERWKQTKEILRELHRLRREDHHAQKLRLEQEKRDVQDGEREDEAERKFEESRKKSLLDTAKAHRDLPMMAYLRGGGEYGWKWAYWEMCVEHDLPMPSWWDPENPEFEIPPADQKAEGRMKEEKSHVPSSQTPSTGENSSAKIKGDEENDYENEDEDEAVKANQGESRSVKAGQGEMELSPKSKVQGPKSDGTNGTIRRRLKSVWRLKVGCRHPLK